MKKDMRCLLTSVILLFMFGMLSACGKENSESQAVAVAQEEAAPKKDYENVITIGETTQKETWSQTEVYSSEIQDTFVVDVCLPKEYDATKKYPVVYLTDCNWRREDYKSLTELYESGKIREFILVGIGYPDSYDFDTIRVRDLLDNPDAFLGMIVNGILPYVESTYAIDENDRTFCGASYGAYFMIYSMFQNDRIAQGVFGNYILASPTFFESSNGLPLADYEENYYRKYGNENFEVNIYMSVGGDEDKASFIRPIGKFVKRMEKREYQGMNLIYKEYEGKGHYDVWVPTLIDGLSEFMK
ncbi:MAG: alpha/beta hydrolase-fold protein [Clostridiales bacterium]|nr:alpha/beta hydrolase-fold protein [Clostridiales bacterium]